MPNSAIAFNTAGLATATSPGLVGTGAQTFAGLKTLDGGALIKADTSGAAIGGTYVGGLIASTVNATSIATSGGGLPETTIRTLTLNKGLYLISCTTFVSNYSGNLGGLRLQLRTGTGTFYIDGSVVSDSYAAANVAFGSSACNVFGVQVDGSTVIISLSASGGSMTGTATIASSLRAYRLA